MTNPQNTTVISTLAETTRRAVREQLFMTGELMRTGELAGDTQAATEMAEQLRLFGPIASALPIAETPRG